MSELTWEDPPVRKHGKGRRRVWEERLAPLRDHPGRWANVGKHHATVVAYINTGRCAGIRAGEFEATARGIDRATMQADIYVRFVGGSDE